MTSPLSGPQFGFVWDNLNNGQVAPGNVYVVSGSINATVSITALASAVTVTRGMLVTGTNVPVPNFISLGTISSLSIAVITATSSTQTQTITIQNFPVLIGGEWTATLSAGLALTSSYWNSTGAVRPSDTNQALFADVYWVNGAGNAATVSVGQVITGWFLRSFDGGNTYESAPATASSIVAAVARAPDFIIPLDGGFTYAANVIKMMPQVALPSGYFKTVIQNNGTMNLQPKGAIYAVPITPAY